LYLFPFSAVSEMTNFVLRSSRFIYTKSTENVLWKSQS